MALSEGMVAVVRNAEVSGGLCVTLMDGNRKYTLMPNSEVPLRMQSSSAPYPREMQSTGSPATPTTYSDGEQPRNAYDNSTQAVDGQYASIYKMAHCNLHPTSPPVELTEFPPQRPQVCPGQENFVIGGCGGNSHQSPPRNCNNFRMGTSWVAQGTPAPRPAHRRDSFASSLRNYPSMSPERSSEVLQRLVNYSNMRKNRSPNRLMIPKNHSQFSKSSAPMPEQFQQIDSRLARSPRADLYDESPTRDRWQSDEEKQSLPSRCDVRSMTEEKLKDFQRVFGTYPVNLCPTMERFNHIPSKYSNMPVNRHHSVNMETQADCPTVSRETATVPRPPPEVKNVAVFVSPASSSPPNSDPQHRRLKIIRHSKSISIQTQISDVLILRRKSVQTCFSSVNLKNYKKVGHKRRSKSQDVLKINDDFDEQIVQIIQDLTKPSAHLRNKPKKQKKQKHDKHEPKVKIDKRENQQILFSERNLKEFTRELSNDLLSKIKRENILMQPTDLYRANYYDLFKTNHEQCFIDDIVIEWLKDIPIKRTDYLGRPVVKEHILKTVGDKVRNVLLSKLKYISEASTKSDIIDILDDMPIDVTGHTRRFFLNKIVSELISTVRNSTNKEQWKKLPAFCDYIQPTDQEVQQLIENEVTDLQRKFSLLICHDTVGQMINELTAILLDSIEAIRRGKIRDVIDEVLTITSEFVTISEFQSIYFAHNLVYNLFQQSYCNDPQPCDFFCYSSQIQENISNNTNSSVENETGNENTTNRPDYAGQVSVQVNEWLSSINDIEKINPSLRLVVVHDLTGDIVDRQKYLEMNPSLQNTEVEELEHLRYQIFKWVNKVLGEDNTDTLAKAPDLLTRIKSIPVTQTESQEEGIVIMPKPTDRSSNVSNVPRSDSRPDGQACQSSIRPPPPPPPPPSLPPSPPPPPSLPPPPPPPVVLRSPNVPSAAQNKSVKQLNEEYDAYLKDWVQRVPIAFANPEEEAIAEKARLGLYIGIWKAITKLKMSPETLDNPYHYQDALDDELEVLLQCLPQTRELKTKKHVLKPELIEKTMIFNERVANVSEGSSYRQQLVDNVNNSLPKQTDINIAGKNADRLYEEWQKNMLAELYILTNRFKVDDRVKAIAYKKKLMRHIEKMIDNIKANTKQEIKELDHRTYEDEILAALDEVPIPSDETLNEEADEILILLEVEQWFRDLPLLPSKRETANMEAKIFQDLLARKLYDIDAHCNPTKRTDLMKQEIRRFLERLPLREEEKPNMSFMIEELLNRLNNLNSDVVVVGGEKERKSVNFLAGYDYDAFSRNLPISSTFEGNPPRDPHDGSSYLIAEGARVPDEQGWQMIKDPTGISEQYLTIEGLTGPRMPSCCASSSPQTPQNGGAAHSNQFPSPNQGPFQTEQTKNYPGSGNGTKNGQASSRSIQIMEDQGSNLRNQNQSCCGPPAGGYDPNRLQPPPVDRNKTAMPQQYRTSSMASPRCVDSSFLPTSQDTDGYAIPRQQVNGAYNTPRPQRVRCCDMPTVQDYGASAMPRPQQSGTSGMPTLLDNGAYGMSRPQGSNTPQELRTSGTSPMPNSQQAGTSTMPTSQDYRPSAMPRPQQSGTCTMPTPDDCIASTMPRPQSGTSPMPRSQLPGCCVTPSYGVSAIPRPQEQRAPVSSSPIDNGSSGMPRPQSSSTPQDLRTTEQGTNPIPRTLDSGTTPARCRSVRRSSAPPSYRPNRSQYQNSVPPIPDPYTPYSTPDNEDHQTPRNYRKERRESARRKLSFEESENDSDTDFGCRCMEKIWRCTRRKPVCQMRGYIPCEEIPYFMRMREPCYYRS